jgi:hypothetical protein
VTGFIKLGRNDAPRERERLPMKRVDNRASNHAGTRAGRRGKAKSAPKRKPKLTPEQFAARFKAEKVLQLRRYCDAFALWRSCPRRACRRHQTCGGDAKVCLRRAFGRVPHPVQWRARQAILDATPRNCGAPELKARQYMPLDFYE